MADFYTYRSEVAGKRRKRKLFLALIVLLALLCAGAGFYWFRDNGTPAPQEADSAAAQPTATAESTMAPTAAPTQQPIAEPQRLVQSVDTAVWDKSESVAQTIDTEFLNTDHRMVAVPMLGTVTKDYFNTVTFAGDSIAAGLGIYDTGYHNAHYATYVSAGVQTFVNNVSVKNAVTGANETPMETIAASQPDYLYILVGTNNLVVQGSEDSFIAYYERLIDMLREQLNPGVTIYIQSIPGVQEDVVASKPGLDNTRIATVNDLLANMALRKGCYYINIREALTNQPDRRLRHEGRRPLQCGGLPCLGRISGHPHGLEPPQRLQRREPVLHLRDLKIISGLHKSPAKCKKHLAGDFFCTFVRKNARFMSNLYKSGR